jgi:DNA-binding CsgD family transcriptional regulator
MSLTRRCKQKIPKDSRNSFRPVSPFDSDDALLNRTKLLIGDEFEIYKWLREFYSERWIAETLLLGRCEARAKIRQVYRKLGVRNKKSLIQAYNRLKRPQKGPVETAEVDRYTDARIEEEIQRGLDAKEGKSESGENS